MSGVATTLAGGNHPIPIPRTRGRRRRRRLGASAPVIDFQDEFLAHLKTFRAAPFLFVGAGLSRRYLGLDGWEALLRRLAALTGQSYEYYSASADGDYPRVASLIAEELHPLWWSDERFTASRAAFDASALKHRDSALKAEASLYLAGSMSKLSKNGELADELGLLQQAVVDGIISTNFDPLLEHLFPDYRVFIGQERLLFNDAVGIAEIYKIHGSHEDPDSLVLTEADYAKFDERNPYLAAKLMTIFVEHPIVFLGYSLSDRNIAAILSSIISCLDSSDAIARLADRLIFVQWDGSAAQPTMAPSVIRVDSNPIPVRTVTVPDFVDVYTALSRVERTFPAKLLRQLKEQVYDLVLSSEAKKRLHVLELTDDDDPSTIEVVFGVGAISQLRSYVGLRREDLLNDLIDEEIKLNSVRVVQEALPSILSHAGNVPIFKYLREAGMLDQNGALLDAKAVDKKIAANVADRAKRLGVLATYKKAAKTAVDNAGSFDALIQSEETPHNILQFIPALDEDGLDPETLRRFLVKNADMCANQYRSQWIKMACLYDWLRYGRQKKAKTRRGPRPHLKQQL
jgi:hypothetical protein